MMSCLSAQIIPVLVATGLFMGLRGAAQSLGVQFSENLLRMSQILTDTAFAFLPALAAKTNTSSSFIPLQIISVTLGFPSVIVPVLSNTIVSILYVVSKASPPLINTPFSAPFPVPTIIAVGVAEFPSDPL